MKKLIALLMALVMTMSFATVAWGAGATYYVSSAGDDAAAGTDVAPLKTIEAALAKADVEKIVLLSNVEATRSLNVTSSITITSKDGETYAIKKADGFTATYVFFVSGNDAVLTLTNIVIDGNKQVVTAASGAIKVTEGASLVINKSVIENNKTGDRNNVVPIYANGAKDVTLENGTIIQDNESGTYAGGIVVIDLTGTFTLDATSKVINNKAATDAGGIRIKDSDAIIAGEISRNSVTATDGKGGGLYTLMNDTTKTVTVDGAKITGNTATEAGSDMLVNGPSTSATPGNVVIASGTIGEVAITRGALDVNGGAIDEIAVLPDARNDKGAVLEVTDGNIGSVTKTGTGGSIAITGGTFSTDVSEYVAEGYQLLANGTVVATPAASATDPVLYQWDNAGAEWDAYFIATGADLDDLKRDASDDCLDCYCINGEYFVEVKEAAATFKLVYGAKTVFLAPVAEKLVKYEDTASVLKVVDAEDAECGEYYVTALDEDDVYYVSYDKKGEVDGIWVAAKNGSEQILVNGKIVDAEDASSDVTFMFHEFEGYDVVNKQYTTVKCEDCGKVAKLYANAEAATVGKKAPEKIDTLGWITYADYYDFGANAPVVSGPVESAKTFDAGIAMYVGMSVMAAAGSAVVLKKKD